MSMPRSGGRQAWDELVQEVYERLGAHAAPSVRIPGVNPITPMLVGFFRDSSQDVFELSAGHDFGGVGWIFGITFPRCSDGSNDPRDCCVHSLDEALAAVGRLDGDSSLV